MSAMDTLIPTLPPIERDADGVFRVAGTRVRLETIITAFQLGSIPETIHYKYPATLLADIYAVITYYLQNMDEVETYLAERRQKNEAADREIILRSPTNGIRERLLARRANS